MSPESQNSLPLSPESLIILRVNPESRLRNTNSCKNVLSVYLLRMLLIKMILHDYKHNKTVYMGNFTVNNCASEASAKIFAAASAFPVQKITFHVKRINFSVKKGMLLKSESRVPFKEKSESGTQGAESRVPK